jgi:hypothetical protein
MEPQGCGLIYLKTRDEVGVILSSLFPEPFLSYSIIGVYFPSSIRKQNRLSFRLFNILTNQYPVWFNYDITYQDIVQNDTVTSIRFHNIEDISASEFRELYIQHTQGLKPRPADDYSLMGEQSHPPVDIYQAWQEFTLDLGRETDFLTWMNEMGETVEVAESPENVTVTLSLSKEELEEIGHYRKRTWLYKQLKDKWKTLCQYLTNSLSNGILDHEELNRRLECRVAPLLVSSKVVRLTTHQGETESLAEVIQNLYTQLQQLHQAIAHNHPRYMDINTLVDVTNALINASGIPLDTLEQFPANTSFNCILTTMPNTQHIISHDDETYHLTINDSRINTLATDILEELLVKLEDSIKQYPHYEQLIININEELANRSKNAT